MTIAAPAQYDVFTARIFKRYNASPTPVWSNTYELQCKIASSLEDLVTEVGNIVAFEQYLELTNVRFDRMVISSYEPDGEPYDPSSFVTVPLAVLGLNDLTGGADEQVPLQVCLFLRREVATGRTGKLLLRGCLEEADIEGSYGSYALTNPSAWITKVATAITDSGLDDQLVGGAGNYGLVMASGSPSATSVRAITGIVPVDARITKFDHRYYDVP